MKGLSADILEGLKNDEYAITNVDFVIDHKLSGKMYSKAINTVNFVSVKHLSCELEASQMSLELLEYVKQYLREKLL